MLTTMQWSVTTSPELFNVSGNHVNTEDEVEENINVNIANVRTHSPGDLPSYLEID
jgi:hypothetical protein